MNTINLANMNYSFQDIYISVYYLLSSNNYYFNLFQINYLKKFFEIIIKNILFQKLNSKYKNIIVKDSNKNFMFFYFKLKKDIKNVFL